ncbi:transglutaminase domain-containing protein [Isoalcanivorax beigongshangi]|uniref:Transglutaminase domain-containing protein n=1 Tax=Isoalcanivorax beigongshangi TaxID=3238810 RepID=A0ABV4AIL5_9GAMM
MKPDPALPPYLAGCRVIEVAHPAIRAQAEALRVAGDARATAEQCFLFVRDQIDHCVDVRRNPVTCTASEVLAERVGYCYAKSHLLAALLRAAGLPAGLCYQRLRLAPGRDQFCLHGLNAVYLPRHGWYRIDARGNKPGVDAAFVPPKEQLAFALQQPGEHDFPGIWAEPWPEVIAVLESQQDWQQALEVLPDRLPQAVALAAGQPDWRHSP